MEKDRDFERLGLLMAMLGENFDKEVTPLKIELYFNALKDFSIKEVEQSVYLAVKTLKFFPKIAELRELIEGSLEDRALVAWRMAIEERDYYHSVEFDDKIIHYCIQEIFGGWMSFCEKTLDELKWEEKRFLELYRIALKRPDLAEEVPKEMLGSYNIDNSKRGFLSYVLPVRKVTTKTKEKPQIKSAEIKFLP